VTSPIAILKPDHLGDLVLAAPAIRAIRGKYHNVTLFVASRSLALARFLFPEIPDVRGVDLRHLARCQVEGDAAATLPGELNRFDHVVCLRDDAVMRDIVARLSVPCTMVSSNDFVHETSLHKHAVECITGPYSRTRLFSDMPPAWPARPKHVGLCIAAGFPTNLWATSRWRELATLLGGMDIQLTLIGGPRERDELRMLSRLSRRIRHRVLIGGDDFSGFLQALEPVDLIVATDGGTAHICSLRKPVCSIFGPGPWRRYAPFGRHNVVLTRDEPCSPCMQFSTTSVNCCVTRECMARIKPSTVMRVVASNGLDFAAAHGPRIELGVSHRYEMNAQQAPSRGVLPGPPVVTDVAAAYPPGGTANVR
jgi:ADP-heptose:LPS heptosyltransferase